MKIEVTQEDIDHGMRLSALRCPVSLAVDRATQLNDSLVSSALILVGDKIFKTAPEVAAFVVRFDSFLPVEPFSFELPCE